MNMKQAIKEATPTLLWQAAQRHNNSEYSNWWKCSKGIPHSFYPTFACGKGQRDHRFLTQVEMK